MLNTITFPFPVKSPVPPLLNALGPILPLNHPPTRMPVVRFHAPTLGPLQYLGVVPTHVFVVDSRTHSLDDVTPGVVDNAGIGLANECLSDLVDAVIYGTVRSAGQYSEQHKCAD